MNNYSSLLMLLSILALAACGAHRQPADGDAGGGTQSTSAGQAPGSGRNQATANSACAIPDGLERLSGMGMPSVAVPTGVTVRAARAGLEIVKDGEIRVHTEVEIAAEPDAKKTASVGYAWRLPAVGRSRGSLLEEISFETLSGSREGSCAIDGPAQMVQPYRDEARWVEVDVPAGGQIAVRSSYSFRVERAEKPVTLFGFHDRFADNWRNWSWPYIHAPEYARVADRDKPYHGRFGLLRAPETRVLLRVADGTNCLRGMSHEQNVEVLRMPAAWEWRFSKDDVPADVEFEYLPGLSFTEEIETFAAIAKARPGDLRARIRLSDLHRFGGDATTRVEILRDLLAAWTPDAAKEQMLFDRNDIRGPALVGLTRALLVLRRDAEARDEARRGVDLLRALPEAAASTEANRLARLWLERVSAESKSSSR